MPLCPAGNVPARAEPLPQTLPMTLRDSTTRPEGFLRLAHVCVTSVEIEECSYFSINELK